MISRLIGENIRVDCRLESGCAGISMDASQLDQIVINLCLNARDAISGCGTITVETGTVHVDPADCKSGHSCRIPGDFVRLSVADTGHGIKKEHLPHIFEPFFTTKEVGKGTGIGLSTIYGIVKKNGGYIDCATEEGNGTLFSIYFPVDSDKASHDAAMPLKQPKETILLVEDEPDIRRVIKKILENNEYRVLVASDAEQAMDTVKHHAGQIVLLITDVVLPKMNGIKLSNTLRARMPELKTLFMSGYAYDMVGYHRAQDADEDFIQKPFSIRDFMKLVDRLLSSLPSHR